ncbi:metastasis-associated in colon cancer protein 1 [Striga asiatica]|uniref:Metastasis-associated in colon cancer protein 1 n=1 Tax=Striga asiatica TaxID=4170 RepID=A0A5A7QSJ9_STRAF|nr:metastasis-associated in colon cancer protein 1 [Striga asiatica]
MGFDGLVRRIPRIFWPRFLAWLNVCSRDVMLSVKFSHDLQWTGISSTPVRHLMSLSNLKKGINGTRKAFPWSARQNVSISSAAVAPQVNITCEGSKDKVRPITSAMKSAMACNIHVIFQIKLKNAIGIFDFIVRILPRSIQTNVVGRVIGLGDGGRPRGQAGAAGGAARQQICAGRGARELGEVRRRRGAGGGVGGGRPVPFERAQGITEPRMRPPLPWTTPCRGTMSLMPVRAGLLGDSRRSGLGFRVMRVSGEPGRKKDGRTRRRR